MNVIVLGLPKDISEEKLMKLFTHYGEVESCDLVMDEKTGKSKGFGFVEMKDDYEAGVAIEALHGSRVSGNKIRVKINDKTT